MKPPGGGRVTLCWHNLFPLVPENKLGVTSSPHALMTAWHSVFLRHSWASSNVLMFPLAITGTRRCFATSRIESKLAGPACQGKQRRSAQTFSTWIVSFLLPCPPMNGNSRCPSCFYHLGVLDRLRDLWEQSYLRPDWNFQVLFHSKHKIMYPVPIFHQK